MIGIDPGTENHRPGIVGCAAHPGLAIRQPEAGQADRQRDRDRRDRPEGRRLRLVVGLPLSMDGTAGPAAQAVTGLDACLSAATGLPAALWDERLSSAAVNRFLINEADLTRAKRAEAVDRAAAAWMLQAALDVG